MSLKPLLEPEAFWQFACELYEADGVKERCLYSQNQLGLNVNLLLLCAWLARHQRTLTQGQWQKVIQSLENSDKKLVELRQQRQSHTRGSSSYKACLQQELELEAQQQQLILRTLNDEDLPGASLHPLVGYFEASGCNETRTRDELVVLFSDEYKESSH